MALISSTILAVVSFLSSFFFFRFLAIVCDYVRQYVNRVGHFDFWCGSDRSQIVYFLTHG